MNRWLCRNSLVLGCVACAVTIMLGYFATESVIGHSRADET